LEALSLAVEGALPAVRWFAMGEAIELHDTMVKALKDYRASPNGEATINGLKVTALWAYEFLVGRGTNQSREAARNLIERLEALDPKKEK